MRFVNLWCSLFFKAVLEKKSRTSTGLMSCTHRVLKCQPSMLQTMHRKQRWRRNRNKTETSHMYRLSETNISIDLIVDKWRPLKPGVVNQWFPIDWLQSIQSIIINNNPLIVIDWCNQSIKIDTHTRSLNCYWLPLITIENHWLIIHYATFWRVLAWACFIGPGHIYTSRVIG